MAKETDAELLKRLARQHPDPKLIEIKGLRNRLKGLRKENTILRMRIMEMKMTWRKPGSEPSVRQGTLMSRVAKFLVEMEADHAKD